jgi:hypothetical protein
MSFYKALESQDIESMRSTLDSLIHRYQSTGYSTYRSRIKLLSLQLNKLDSSSLHGGHSDQLDLFGVPYMIATFSNSHVSEIYNKDIH